MRKLKAKDCVLIPKEPTSEMLKIWKTMYGYSRYTKYKAMLGLIPPIEPENPWRPIETALKDPEELIWCFSPHSCGGYQYPAYRCPERGEQGFYICSLDQVESKPTHWMPLPEPPKVEE